MVTLHETVAASPQEAEHYCAIELFNSENFKSKYITWVKGKETLKLKGSTNDKFQKVVDMEETENIQKLRTFCQENELPDPDFYDNGQSTETYQSMCKLALTAKNSNKEEACKILNKIIMKICEKHAVKIEQEEQAKLAEYEESPIDEKERQERLEKNKDELERLRAELKRKREEKE